MEQGWALNPGTRFGVWLAGSREPQRTSCSPFTGALESPHGGWRGAEGSEQGLGQNRPSWSIPTCLPAAEQGGSYWVPQLLPPAFCMLTWRAEAPWTAGAPLLQQVLPVPTPVQPLRSSGTILSFTVSVPSQLRPLIHGGLGGGACPR